MAAHALARRGLSAALAALAALAPAVAAACPYCAGRAGGGVATGVILASFVLLPFLVVWIVYRVIRAEARLGDATMLDVAEHLTDRPIRADAHAAPVLAALAAVLPHRVRREAE
jgi:hypothetical protein